MDTNEVLDALAARFGTSIDHLWDVLLRQARIEGWMWAALALVSLALLVGSIKQALSEDAQIANSDGFFFSLALIAAFLLLISVGVGLPMLLNPEYYALKLILP